MSKRSRQRNRQLLRTELRLAKQNGDAQERTLPPPPLLASGNGSEAEVLRAVERQLEGAASKQPRFNVAHAGVGLWSSLARWTRLPTLKDEPTEQTSYRAWDTWLRIFAFKESYFAGVLNNVVQIDQNRHWSLTGGRNQVRHYTDILKGAGAANGMYGWRPYVSWQAQSFYLTQMGFVSETGREGEGGPLRALWAVDPCACELTGDPTFPLKYHPTVAGTGWGLGMQQWRPEDFFRGTSLVSTDERALGYGFPAVARAYNLALIMLAVVEHDKEELGARAPRGLLLLKGGITEDQWETAMEARSERLDGLERKYFGGVAVLAGASDIDAVLIGLSQLPRGFDYEKWVALYMYALALMFGYDAREFYPVSGGQLGTATETETQHRKATSKGDRDFALNHQEQLQAQLPASLLFEYEERDVEGETADVQAQLLKAQLITEVSKWLINTQSVLTPGQVLQLAAQHGVIPSDWTPEEEDVESTDTSDMELERMAHKASIRRAAETFPDEPIVKYTYPLGTEKIVLARGADLLTPRQYYSIPKITRVKSSASIVSTFRTDLRRLIREYCSGSVAASLLRARVLSLVSGAIAEVYFAGLREAGVPPEDFTEEDSAAVDSLTEEQRGFVNDFAEAIQDGCEKKQTLYERADLWSNSVQGAAMKALAQGAGNEVVTWHLGATEEHCKTCPRLDGQRHRRKWFSSRNYFPRMPGAAMQCGGFRCQCTLTA